LSEKRKRTWIACLLRSTAASLNPSWRSPQILDLPAVESLGGAADWRIRVGDYRVIYQIADTIRVVRVMRVRRRREAYR
jgi:mRNA-degrading endonuclease RelE of RelBE toxin-antitoxin system